MRKILLIIIIIISWKGFSQATNGMSGLIHIPSARMLEDGQLVLGAAYIPKPYFFRYGRNNNPGINTYITYGILPFVELMFRYTHELNLPVNIQTRYFPDRMFGLRLRVFKEKKHIPAIVLGFQDPSSLLGTADGATNYAASYFVLSKILKSDLGNFDFSLGYAQDFFNLRFKDIEGLFGGVSFTPIFFDKISFSIEHNSKGINTGIGLIGFSKFNLMLGVWNLDKPTFSFNYLF